MSSNSESREFASDFLSAPTSPVSSEKVQETVLEDKGVHEQLQDLQQVVVSDNLEGLEKKIAAKPSVPFALRDILVMPGKESKEYKEVAEEFQSFEAAVALVIGKCFQLGVKKEDLSDPKKFFALSLTLPSDLQESYKKAKEIFTAGSKSPYYALFFGGTIWKAAVAHLEKVTAVTKTVEKTVIKETNDKSAAAPVSLPEKMLSGVSSAAGDVWAWTKENPVAAVALAGGGLIAVKVWKWLFAPKEEAGTFSTFSSLVKWGGLAGGGLLLMSQYDTIKNYLGSWFGKSGSILDMGKIAYDLIGAIAKGDWNKVLQIVSANVDSDPDKKPVYDAMEKASGVDRNFLVYIASQAYEGGNDQGFFHKMFDKIKGIPSTIYDAGKSYFLGFTDQHKGKLLKYLDQYKSDISSFHPKPTTYFEVFEGLYKAGKLDGQTHDEYISTTTTAVQKPETATAAVSVDNTKTEEQEKDHTEENKAQFESLHLSEAVKNDTDVTEKMQELQKKYMSEELLEQFITECYAHKVDTKALESLQKKRLAAMDTLKTLVEAKTFDKQQFEAAYAEVEAANGELWEEYKNVFADAHSRNIFTQAVISSPRFLKFVRMYERYTKYPQLYRYVVYKATISKAQSSLHNTSAKRAIEQNISFLRARGVLTADEQAALDRFEKLKQNKDFHALYSAETNLHGKITSLDAELAAPNAVDTGNKKANLLKKYKNELELVKLQQEELEIKHDLKSNPTDPQLLQKKSALDKKILDTRSQKMSNIENNLTNSGKTKLDKDVFKELETFKLEVKKQQALLDKMQGDLFAEVRSLKGKTQVEIDAVKSGLLDKTKDFYAKQTQLQTDKWNKFRQVSLHASENDVEKLKKWVKDIGLVHDGKKIVSLKGKFAIFGATVTAGAIATEFTSGGSFMNVLKETGQRMLWGYGTVIDLYEGVTGTNWFHPNERLDNDARLLSTAMGVASGASEVLSLVPFTWGLGLAGKAGVITLKGAKVGTALKKANKLEDALNFLDGVKDSKTFMAMKGAANNAQLALMSSSVLMTLAGINIMPKQVSEIEITPEMKKILGDQLEDKNT